MTTKPPITNPMSPIVPSSFDISKLPTDKEPLPESEINIYNLIFKDQPIAPEQQQETNKVVIPSKMPMTKKALISFMFACIVILHAITPVSTILKAFQGNTYIMILIAVAYTAVIYYAINTLLC